QPMTPAGRLFIQEDLNQVINCAVIGEFPVASIDSIKAEIKNSIILRHPRFCSLVVRGSDGREYWRKTEVDIDRHLIVRGGRLSEDLAVPDEDVVNDYLADLAYASPLPTDKPLWEVHVLMEHKCAVFRVHHALGDGVSLMSMLLTCCRKVDDPTKTPEMGGGAHLRRKKWSFGDLVKVTWFSLIFALELIARFLWRRDKRTALRGGAGVEDWPRKVATARFRLGDMKTVKAAVAGATINDVLFGVISNGFSRYLTLRSPEDVADGAQITGTAMVNLRQHPQLNLKVEESGELETQWGNKFGMILLPVYYHKRESNPLDSVRRAKEMIDKKKLSLEAFFSYKLLHLITAKLASIVNYRVICNTTFTISNVVGPKEKISLAGNPVKCIRVTSSSLPHAITMHMVSYGGFADMQIQVAKEIIPDPRTLALCFQDALLDMAQASR
ncbi:hypothetical protein M569_10500, partial [Genlisea aurea]